MIVSCYFYARKFTKPTYVCSKLSQSGLRRVNLFMQFGMSALHHAVHCGKVDTIRMLVQELHADPDIKDLVSQAYVCVYT